MTDKPMLKLSGQDLVDAGVNVWALHLLLESVKGKVTEPVTFQLLSNDPRHQGVSITLAPVVEGS